MKQYLSFSVPYVVLLIFFGSFIHPVYGQTKKSTYDPHAAFAPDFITDGGNLFRSADGTPGKRYWQNEADYTVKARLDTTSKKLSGDVKIHYVNNSPNGLDQLWLQLVHNSERSDSRSNAVRGYRRPSSGKKGFHLHKVRIKINGKWQSADYVVAGTRMQIRLPKTLKGGGNAINIDINYDYPLPKHGRSGYVHTQNGTIYDISYWYPRMCVYDDLRGWNTLPFLGEGEFYLDYGTIDYKITLPQGMLVAGSGKLMNPGETLTEKERKQLEKARHSSKTVMIRSKNDLDKPATAQGKNGMLTWHFHMKNTRDVAWAASKAFMWDAARATYKKGHTLAESVYPVESAGQKAWGRATQYLQHALEYFSNQWMAYPYSSAINVGGPTGGMEYPGITFDSWKATGYEMFLLATHEIGHNWFPMMVGSNERRNAWMDEGFNTFIDVYAHKDFNHGEYAPKRDHEYAPQGGNPADDIVPFITQKGAKPILSLADAFKSKNLHPTEYFKTAFGLVLLREVILGHKRFDYAFRHYMHAWKFKHPGAKDFFRAMNNFSGEKLNWFWRGWFIHDWKLDQAVTGVSYINGNPKNGAKIMLKNMDKMVMPVLMTIKTVQGKTRHVKLPVQIWMKGATYIFHTNTSQKIARVVLDAKHKLPDVNRANNSWSGK